MEVVLTMIDTAGIQGYIFGSNRLRENIGASYLVEQATRDWVYDELKQLGGHNIKDPKPDGDETDRIDRSKLIEDEGQRSEMIFAGGGNTAILFQSKKDAKEVAWRLSRRILEDAPGLEIVIAHSDAFEWKRDGENLRDQVEKLRDGRLAEKKRMRQATLTPLLGLGVTAECEATGLVATQQSTKDLEPEPRLISCEASKKLAARNDANNRLRKLFAQVERIDDFEFSDELDQLGRTGGEESYIAVVHVDGNDMGEIIKDYVKNAAINCDYLKRMRDFSQGVERASKAALVKTLDTLRQRITREHDPKTERDIEVITEDSPQSVPEASRTISQQKRIRLFQEEKEKRPGAKPCWPFRPLVFGGDDVTFVCNGQLGLSLATVYMNAFTAATREQIEDFLDKDSQKREIHTGAGVCIVKVHYPFRRAYDLSDALTKSAKRHLKDEKPKASALDWHISSTGLSGSLSTIRAQEYEIRRREPTNPTQARTLLMRPVRMQHETEWRTWQDFKQFVAAFNYDKRWAGHRNQVKALREALRAGEEAVKEFLDIHKFADTTASLPEPINTQWQHLCEKGWESNRCVYFDAIEAMDHHLILEDAKS